MNSKKRLYGAAAAIVLTPVLLTGCLGSPQQEGSTKDEGFTIRIASAETSAGAMEVLNAAATAYTEKTGIDVVVEAIPLTEIYTKVNSAWGTSAEYSAFATGFIGHVSLFESEDRLVPVGDIIDTLGGEADFYDGIQLFPIEGETYWVPFDYNLAFGILRSDWLADAGLDVPTDWDELRAVVEAFDARDDSTYGLIMPLKADSSANWITSLPLWAAEVELFDEDFALTLDDAENLPKAVEAMDLLKDLYAHMPPGAENATYANMIESFVGEQVGMTFFTGRVFDTAIKQKPALADNMMAFGFPMQSGDGVAATYGGDGMAVFDTGHADETKKFLEFFYQEHLVDLLATDPFHYFPSQKSVFESDGYRAAPGVEKYWEQGIQPQYDILENGHLQSIDTSGPYVDFIPSEVFQSMLFPELFQRVTLGGEDSEKAIKETAEKIRALIE